MSKIDQLKPTAQQVKNALDKARAYWHDLAEASMEVFRWVLTNREGRPTEPIHDDEWLDGEKGSSIAMGPSDDFNQRDAMESQISAWMNNIA
ncbi:hypothetical protein BDV35DRAFT_388021 [Aspergillus flavus]|uniref:Uncharacterized protein n=1 Tax=Aspergillus flavus TaxID=5059 RepID=A0A364LRC7_ASPFL|nr:hypothetical protein BDV35DRAFT_388021 [Aspergillus flavus]KAJ1716736.1 hypothetical protein NYO67_1087 [Aspergillus flavus]RAQ57600.1 hypothetical protein COH21_008257 [Aspergillus flavus]RAQ74228.1 hypothetical protein COH20_008955 [Aspergillus flavus]RMZ37925.1 hypothetical protein CA14_004708 [Aspergillus flavus]